jgi:hypothetical protein
VVTNFKALEDFRVSHDGEAWVLKGRSQLGSELETCLLLGAGLTGDMFAQEGQPLQGGVAGELYDFFDGTANPASFDTAGNIGFGARARGGSSAIDEKVVVYNATTGVHTVVLKEGDPALGLFDYPPDPSGDEIFGSSIASIHLRDDGLVGFANTPIGNCHSFRYPAFFVGNNSFRQSGVSVIGGFVWDSFDYDDCGGTPDGLHWYAKGDIEGVPTTSNRILAVDDNIELREGSPVPGSAMIAADVFHTKMVSNGDWFSRGDDDADNDWAIYNSAVVAETGDEIGSTGEHLGAVFLAFAGNRVGDWVLVANTDDPDTSRDTVLLLNGEVFVREGDPVDLDGNGAFDDDVFIGRGDSALSAFAPDDIFLSDDGMLYFIAPLRNAAGEDLGSDPPFGSGGDAFMGVQLGPEPCNAEAVRSYKDHGGTRLYLDMGVSGGIEPRLGGIVELDIELDSAAGFSGGVSVDCTPCGWSGSATAAVTGNTVTVVFDTALPDTCCCTVTLDCGAEVCVCGLEGDIDRGGLVSTGDASIIKPHFGDTPTDADAEFDFDVSGLVTTGDFSQVKPKFGNSAQECP